MKIKTKTLLVALSLSAMVTKAQPWMASVKSDRPTFQELQTAFNQYWQNRPYERSQGYKVFKRWEWFWQSRLLQDGSFPSPSINREELLKYRRTHTPKGKVKSANWEFKGPTTAAGGYYGVGRINTIAFHPTNVNTFWVGTPGGGLWKTTDGGATWSSNTDNLGVLGVSGIAINPADPNTMYIATGDGESADTYSMGILKSTDGGNTWNTTVLNLSVSNGYIFRKLVMSPANPQLLIAASNGGLVRTVNGFASLSNVEPGFFSDVEFHPTDPNTVYAASHSSVTGKGYLYTSVNAGATWKAVDSIPSVRRINLEVSPAAPNVVHALCANSSGGFAGIWSSADKGTTYTATITGTTSNNILHNSNNGSGSGGQGTYDLAFAVNPANASQLWVGGVNTWVSNDGGLNWTLKNYWSTSSTVPTVHADKHFLAFHPLSPTTLFECNDGGLYKTANNGLTWTNLSNGLGISQIYRIGLSANNADRVLAGLQDNSTKKLLNGTWSEAVPTGDGFESIVDYNNPDIMYTSSYYGRLLKSTNGGATWSEITKNDGAAEDEEGPWLTPYVMHPTNSTTLIMAKSQVFQTTDGGTTWTQLGTLPAGAQASAIAYAPSNPQTIYVATNSASGNQVYKSTDGGTTWTLIANTTLTDPVKGSRTTQFISGLAVHPSDPQRLWITQGGYTTGSKVWYTTNGGASWSNVSGTLPNVPANCIVYQNGTKDGLYLGTDIGVFYIDGDETDWQAFQTGLPNVVVNELEVSYTGKKLWAATYGRGLWSTDIAMPAPCTPPAAPVSGGDVTACGNVVPVTLTATPPAGATIDWYSTSTGGSPIATAATSLNANTAGMYYAEARNTVGGCKSATRTLVTLTLNAAPATPTVATSASTTFCEGSSVTLTSSAASGNQWYKNGTAISGATNATYVANASGIYTVKVTSGSCTSTASANTTVTVNAVPAQPTITQNGNVLQSSATAGNQWYFNGTALPLNATGQTYTPSGTGQFTVIATVNGCSSVASAPFAFAITSVNSPELDNQLLIAPNPVNTKLVITYKGNAARFQVTLLDISGKQVLAKGTFTSTYTLDMSRYSAGPYLIRITNERSKEQVQRVIMKN